MDLRISRASRHRDFRFVWTGQVISAVGDAAFFTALGWRAFTLVGSQKLGIVFVCQGVGLLTTLLIGGALADRLPRHRVMVAANALNCVSQGLFALLVLTGDPQLWQMMLLTALNGTGQAFFSPAAEGMLLSSVRGEQAGRAFAVFRMAMQGAALGGAALGMLGSKAGKGVVQRFGIDEFSIGPSTAGLSDQQVVTVGKAVSEKISVGYEQSLTSAANVAKLTWAFSRRWSLIARGGTIKGLSLLFNRRFDSWSQLFSGSSPRREGARREQDGSKGSSGGDVDNPPTPPEGPVEAIKR